MTLTLILTLTLALPPSPTLILTRYKLEESASMGGLNLVKLALDMKTERRVALKFMGVKDDFVREVSFLKQLRSELWRFLGHCWSTHTALQYTWRNCARN